MVMADKGGVGKTPIAANIAIRLEKSLDGVGIIDADVESPNLPEIMGLSDKGMMVNHQTNKFVPVEYNSGVRIFSMGCFKKTQKKKKKTGAKSKPMRYEPAYALYGEDIRDILHQGIHNTAWGNIQAFVCDLPAGTGDEFSAALENFSNIIGVVIVTMPTTEKDMLRCFYLCSRFFLPVIGVIENMNGANCECGAVMTCPKCKQRYYPFGESDIKDTCEELGIRYLGSIPVSPKIANNFKAGKPLLPKKYDKPISEALAIIREKMGV